MIIKLTESVTVLDNDGYRVHYRNSLNGRRWIGEEQPPEIVAEVMVVWGDVPTMEDPQPEQETPAIQPTPTIEQRTAALESAMLTMLGGVADV